MKNWITKRPYILFLLPGFLLYTVFVIYPIFSAAQISFFQWNGIGPKTFVGFQNYVTLFTNTELFGQLLNAFKNSFKIFALTVLIAIPIQIIIAYIVHSKIKGSSFIQVAVFSPQFISTPIIIFIFTLLLDGNLGIINRFFESIGLDALSKPWLGIPEYGIYVVWLMITWAGLGIGMIYFIGAMKMITKEELESAYVDGAGFWKRLWYIVIPQIKRTILNLVLISYIVGMTIFEFSYILGGIAGGINRSVDVMSLFFYRMAFGDQNPLGGVVTSNSIGMGTTIAVVLFLMIFVVALFQILILYKSSED